MTHTHASRMKRTENNGSPIFLLANGRNVHQPVRLGANVHEETKFEHLPHHKREERVRP